jgi:hypothetical protein
MKYLCFLVISVFIVGCADSSEDGSARAYTSSVGVDECQSSVVYMIDGESIDSEEWKGRIIHDSSCPNWHIIEWDCADYLPSGCQDVDLTFVNNCDGNGWFLDGSSVSESACN